MDDYDEALEEAKLVRLKYVAMIVLSAPLWALLIRNGIEDDSNFFWGVGVFFVVLGPVAIWRAWHYHQWIKQRTSDEHE